MNKIIVGKGPDGRAIELQLAVLLVSRLLIQASSGSGKSYLLRRLLEQTFGWIPHVVIDLEGEFHTLREKYPYVLFGGAGADHKLEVKVAEVLARRILEHGFNCILDLSELKGHDRIRFVRLFLTELLEAPRKMWRPLMVVVDEAHVFCPEQGEAESAGAVMDLMSRGRKRAYCGVLATQRISKLHKDAAADAKNKLIGHASLDLDMMRAGNELGFGKAERMALRDLDPGEFFAYGPAISRTIVKVKGGEIQTTHPEPGKGGKIKPPPAPTKLKGILEQLADLPKQADDEAGELQRLREELRQMRMFKLAPAAAPDPKAIERARVAGKIDGYKAALADLAPTVDHLAKVRDQSFKLIDGLHADLLKWKDRQQGAVARAVSLAAPKLGTRRDSAPSSSPAAPSRSTGAAFKHRPADITPHDGVTRPQQAILDALAWLESVGVDRADRVRVALLADKSPRSGGYRNDLGALRTAGLVDYPSEGAVCLTEAGRAAARHPDTPPTTEELHRNLEQRLPTPQWKILAALIEVYPAHLGREDLAGQTGQSPTSGGFRNNLGALRSLGFISYPRPNTVGALPVLFLER